MALFWQQWRREWCLQARQWQHCAQTLVFFLMIVVFFPLTLPVGAVGLSSMAPGLVWIAALLALLLSAERLFQADYNCI